MGTIIMIDFISSITVQGLQPSGLYDNTVLNFGIVNFFIGKNGSAKTQVLNQIHSEVKNKITSLRPKYEWVGKYLPSNRVHLIQGSRELRSEILDTFETDNQSVESFFQFLNDSEVTKAIVESKLRTFFKKSLNIRSQGRNITMDILEKWRAKEVELKEKAEEIEEDLGVPVNLTSESDGMKEFLILLTYIYHPRVKFVVIDEPELHLHPHMINFLLDAIEETALNKQKQFFIVTHSPIAIRLNPDSNWKYFFFLKEKNEIISFDKFTDSTYASLIPHLNPFKKEAFYSDLIILIEGDGDYQILNGIAKKLGYSETHKGGFTFFSTWGGYNLERLYNFFKDLKKETRIVIDKGTKDKPKAGFTDNFKNNVLTNPAITKTLSVEDIVFLCKKKNELYPNDATLGDEKKREIIREEITLINSNAFQETDYPELVGIIRDILGSLSQTNIPSELVEICQRLVGEFQLRFSKNPFKRWIKENNVEKLSDRINKDEKLKPYWRDTNQDDFKISSTDTGWACELVFLLGSTKIKLSFNEKTDHPTFKPEVIK